MIIKIQTLTIAGIISLSTQATSAVLQGTMTDCLRYVTASKCTHCYRGYNTEVFPYPNGVDYEEVKCTLEDDG